jgi:hypothetical protein
VSATVSASSNLRQDVHFFGIFASLRFLIVHVLTCPRSLRSRGLRQDVLGKITPLRADVFVSTTVLIELSEIAELMILPPTAIQDGVRLVYIQSEIAVGQ